MAMIAPFYKYGFFNFDFSLIIAILIGFAFGFFLERGGLGNAKKLAAQFYFKDFTVLKVMFTAIITAMMGLSLFGFIGLVDMSQVYLNPSYIMPQLLAGLLFGVGFVMAGLCPGTCLVAIATAKFDGLVTLIGIFFGIFIFGEIFDILSGFIYSTHLGQITLSGLLKIPQVFLVLLIAGMGIVMFIMIQTFEKKGEEKKPDNKMAGLNSNKILIYLSVILIFLILFSGYYKAEEDDFTAEEMAAFFDGPVDVHQLADWIMKKKRDFIALDLRSFRQYETYHIPNALLSSENVMQKNTEKIIVYSQFGDIDRTDWLNLKEKSSGSIYYLRGGINTWIDEILFPDLLNTGIKDKGVINKRKMTSYYFGGYPKTGNVSVNKVSQMYKREGC
jgi:uncharacterized membrane protein (DUF485 family)/rhodanese-related sulfurtransferase